VAGGWEALRGALSGTVPLTTPHNIPLFTFLTPNLRHYVSDSDISVRRKTAFLLNTLLTPSTTPVLANPSSGAVIHEGDGHPATPAAPTNVHPNSHASMVADPSSTDTAPATLRALHTHGLLPVLVRELTAPTPYGADGDVDENCDTDLAEKLMRCVHHNTPSRSFIIVVVLCRLLHTYVSAHRGTFDGPEKDSLRTLLDARRATQCEGDLGLDIDELRALESAIA
jgi:hsp70-interacting protein